MQNMLTADTLSKILTPDTIAKLSEERISLVEKNGNKYRYRIMDKNDYPYYHNQAIDFGTKKLLEIMNSSASKDLTPQEKLLFGSEMRFYNEEQIFTIFQNYNITIEDLEEINTLIKRFQKSQIEYTLGISHLERKYQLKLEQVKSIVIDLYPALLNNTYDYKLNQEDSQLYHDARNFWNAYSLLNQKRKNRILAINENETIIKLIFIANNYYNLSPNLLFLFLNKINKLIVTQPDKITNSIQDSNTNTNTKK